MAENKGSWLDTKSNKIVSSQPEEGIQLLAPGAEHTPADLAHVEAVKASLAPEPAAPKTVTSKAVTAEPKTATTRAAEK